MLCHTYRMSHNVSISQIRRHFLYISNGVEQCYTFVDCVRTYVRTSVMRCHRKQTAEPESAIFFSDACTFTK